MIAKGVPRNRYLIPVDDANDKKRILTYNSKGRAEAGFKTSGFYGNPYDHNTGTNKYKLEAVEVEIIIRDVKEEKEEPKPPKPRNPFSIKMLYDTQ